MRLGTGGKNDGSVAPAYDRAYSLSVWGSGLYLGSGEGSPAVVDREDNDREVVGGPVGDMLSMRRKVYVPATGGFARYLEIVTNPTTMTLPVTVGVSAELASDTGTRYVVTPATTAGTYLVTEDETAGSNRPALGHAFAGAGGVIPTVQYIAGSGWVEYEWKTSIAPGETAIFMHFAVQREPGDTSGAQAQAEALVNLTDPNALAGLSVDERARIKNFVINP
jgi:hypothetical protein